MSSDEGYLPEPVRQWVQDKADKHHDGNFGAAAAAILDAAHKAEQAQASLWGDLEGRMRGPGRRQT